MGWWVFVICGSSLEVIVLVGECEVVWWEIFVVVFGFLLIWGLGGVLLLLLLSVGVLCWGLVLLCVLSC